MRHLPITLRPIAGRLGGWSKPVHGAGAMLTALLLGVALTAPGAAHAHRAGRYYGILMPTSPPDYSVLLSHIRSDKVRTVDGYTFHVGHLSGVPVVACVQPIDGNVTQAVMAQKMLDTFPIKALIYAGTAGSHLKRLRIGDVLIARRIVDYGNYITTRSGKIVPGEFHDTEPDSAGSGTLSYLYLSVPLSDLAYRASVSLAPRTPTWMNGNGKPSRTYIMNYGTQGSSSNWLRSPAAIRASDKAFHEADESGGYGTALAALIAHVPFVEFNVISDNALQVPTVFNAYFHKSSLYAQRLAFQIVLRMFEMMKSGAASAGLTEYRDMRRDPYPATTVWNR